MLLKYTLWGISLDDVIKPSSILNKDIKFKREGKEGWDTSLLIKEIKAGEMKIHFSDINGICIAEILSNGIEISNTHDALDIMANFYYQGSQRIIIDEKNIVPISSI